MKALPVLVVEDSFLLAASLEDALREAGHAVHVARTVAEGELAAADTQFQAALLDFLLPDGTSLLLARRLHAAGCAVALVSGAHRDTVPADPAIAALFEKPADEREVIDWITSILQSEPLAGRGGIGDQNARNHR